MSFYERYARIAEQKGIDPCSQKTADVLGMTRAAISTWNTKQITPKGEAVARIADMLEVSADYLLGRTDDPTDYTKYGTPKPDKIMALRKPKKAPSASDDVLMVLFSRLDKVDRIKAQGVIQGMLLNDKYTKSVMPDAAHARTDIEITDAMIAHDEGIMDDENF